MKKTFIFLTLLLFVFNSTSLLEAKHHQKQSRQKHHSTKTKSHHSTHANKNQFVAKKITKKSQHQPQTKVEYTANAIDHIKFRHGHDSTQPTSKFFKSTDKKKLDKLVAKTLKAGKPGKVTNTANKVKNYTFRHPIGVGTNGKKTKSMRVVTNQENEVVTAFPYN
jgi:hypothetical protein